jgi:hypothetical protein
MSGIGSRTEGRRVGDKHQKKFKVDLIIVLTMVPSVFSRLS